MGQPSLAWPTGRSQYAISTRRTNIVHGEQLIATLYKRLVTMLADRGDESDAIGQDLRDRNAPRRSPPSATARCSTLSTIGFARCVHESSASFRQLKDQCRIATRHDKCNFVACLSNAI